MKKYVEKHLEANIKTKVYREFILATNTRVEIVLIHLEQNTIRNESLGHGKRLKLWVKLGLKTDFCNPLISLCKETHIITVERRTAISHRVGHH